MGILASIFRVSNAAVVASGPWELKVLDGSGIVPHVVPTPSATRGAESADTRLQAGISELPRTSSDHRGIRNTKYTC